MTRSDGNQRGPRRGGSPPRRAPAALLLLALTMAVAAALFAALPLSRPAAGKDGALPCGPAATAVAQPDRSDSLAALGRLEPSGTPHGAAPTADDLARLEALERDVTRYRSCHQPASQRMLLANGSAAFSVAVVFSSLLLSRRDDRPRAAGFPPVRDT